MATSLEFVQQLYVSYYGRPAESEGLQYWADRADDEGQESIVKAFGESQEFQQEFGDLSNEELVNNLYQQLFGRDADDAGLEYYTGVLESGDKSLSEIALTISNAAQGSDMEIRDARIEAADAYTDKAGAENYSVSTAKDLLQSIDATDTQGDLDAALAQIEDLPTQSGGEGEMFTLTEGVDTLTGTDGDDTFVAAEGKVFNNFDSIDGGEGRDTLRVDAATANDLNGDISNIEVVSIEGDVGASVDASEIGGLEQLWFVDNDSNSTVTGLTANQTVGFEDSTSTATDLGVASGSTVNVALDASDVNIGLDSTSETVDTLNVTSEGKSSLSLSGADGRNISGNLQNVSVAASGELTLSDGSIGLDLADGEEATFDASASTGNITVEDDVLDQATTVIGGAGNDNFGALDSATSVEAGAGDDTMDLSDNDVKVTVDAGAGDDRIELGDKSLSGTSIDGGEGNDTVVIGTGTFSTQSYDAINTLQNIETVEFSADTIEIDASELDASALTFTGSTLSVSGLGADQSVIVAGDNAGTEQTLNLTDIADTVNVEASYDDEGSNVANTVNLTIEGDDDDAALNLSGNNNVVFDNTDQSVASVDASAMTGTLTYTGSEGGESITLGEDNGSDTLTVDGSTYENMDVITNFDSTVDEDADAEGADVTADVLSEIFGGGNSATEVELGDDVTSLNGAFAAAAGSDADGYAFFNFEDNTYVFNDTGDSAANGEYDNDDFAIQIVGNHDLSSDNAAYNVNVA